MAEQEVDVVSALGLVDIQVPLDDGHLFVRSWQPKGASSRSAILLFHDSLGSVELWRDLPLQLAGATGRRVVAYDRMGFGQSSPRSERLSGDFIGEQARSAVPAICAALGLARLVPFGHSVGGAMAVATAAAWPGSCEAVVTVAAQAFVEARTIEGIEAAMAAFAAPQEFARLSRYHGEKARWVFDAWTETWLSPAFAHWTLDDELRALKCPVLSIHGDQDEYGSLAHPERIVSLAAGGGEMKVIKGCGHVPHREQPQQIIALVQSFLASAAVPPTATGQAAD
ncbi:alpha/beta hydrolase [Novosphingobium sp.]|uniref:alpha/beta fold hydrolase n=1 Tax=Novosphingobium sp. TaxID=1874826 RepID=UPI002619FA1D|nr:alpha/beta hydrolase [Novosphingobium sp.]